MSISKGIDHKYSKWQSLNVSQQHSPKDLMRLQSMIPYKKVPLQLVRKKDPRSLQDCSKPARTLTTMTMGVK